MSSEHKKPFFAFMVITVACCVFMGYTVRANALIDEILESTPASVIAAALRIGVGPADDHKAGEGAVNRVRHRDSEGPRTSHGVTTPTEEVTAEPLARTGFGKPASTSDRADRGHRAEVRQARPDTGSLRDRQRAAAYRKAIHDRMRDERAARADPGRGHGREHAPGQQRKAQVHTQQHDHRRHGNLEHRRSHQKSQSHHANRGNKGHHANRGNRGHHGNKGHRGNHGKRGRH